jgi:hypothetical protein
LLFHNRLAMKLRFWAPFIMLLNLTLPTSWAQSDAQSSDNPATTNGTVAVPPPGSSAQATSSENPPISGLDQPSLEPQAASRSFFIPGAHISEAVDSNISNGFGNASVHGVTRALGSLALQKLWSHYDTTLSYVGGGAFYSHRGSSASQIQQFDADQRILWRTGQLSIRDSFSYLPEGLFGYGSYGGVGGIAGLGAIGGGIVGGGLNGFFGPGQFGSLGQEPRITNVAIADVTQSLSPRSSVTAAGSYGLVHFVDSDSGFINSRQTVAQVGYDYQISRKDQVGLIYGYQAFRYPAEVGTDFHSHIINVLYGHRVSGRMDLVLGGGPQFTEINSIFTGSTREVSGSGRAALRYRLPHSSLSLAYYHFNTSGSGFFAGAKTDTVRGDLNHPFGRVWEATFDVGYSHSSRLAPTLLGIGIPANSYGYVYVGGTAHRQLGRDFSLLLSYQFNDLGFDNSFCAAGGSCRSQRHVAMVGLDWHPRPIRLD